MIAGIVNSKRDAVIPLILHGANGSIATFDAMIDTGFAGSLALPLAVINDLELLFDHSEVFILGNDMEEQFDLYRVIVEWDGSKRPVLALATQSTVLVGMELMDGYHLSIDIADGGIVRLTLRI